MPKEAAVMTANSSHRETSNFKLHETQFKTWNSFKTQLGENCLSSIPSFKLRSQIQHLVNVSASAFIHVDWMIDQEADLRIDSIVQNPTGI